MKSTSAKRFSSQTPEADTKAADMLEVKTTRLTVLESTQAWRIPCSPATALRVLTSSVSWSWRSMGWAVWKTPMQPSMAAAKLAGLSRSALKICSLSDAPGRFVKKLMSLLRSGDKKRNTNKNLFCLNKKEMEK